MFLNYNTHFDKAVLGWADVWTAPRLGGDEGWRAEARAILLADGEGGCVDVSALEAEAAEQQLLRNKKHYVNVANVYGDGGGGDGDGGRENFGFDLKK